MNESKTPFEKGWLETARNDNNGIKISHFFENEKSLCDKYPSIPADIKVNESPSIRCKNCVDTLHKIWKEGKEKDPIADRKDDESDIGKSEDCCQGSNDECKTEESSVAEQDSTKPELTPSAEQDSEMKQDTIEKHSSQS